jgi:GNAT superfamily N-acetyltransferase
MVPHETTFDGYVLSDEPERFDVFRAHAWIADQSYWGENIPFETFAKACANSLVVGVYGQDGAMAAMARVVTDRATFGWICDVFVDEAHRGHSIGKQIIAYLKGHPDLQDFRRMHLATRDAHGLYARFGFEPLKGADRWMQIHDPDVYKR